MSTPSAPAGPAHRHVGARLSAMMFLQFFVWGAWYVSTGAFMDARGLGSLIPWAYTVGPIAAVVSPFFLGFIADRFFATERVLAVMHLLGAGAIIAAPSFARDETGPLFVGLLALHMLCYMPTLGLTNAVAFHTIRDPERQFPLVRVFGTIGWIAANWTVSWLLHADTSPGQFYAAGAAGAALGLYSLTLPHTPPPARGRPVRAADILGVRALALLRDPSFAVFVLGSFLVCIPLAAYYAFAGSFVADVGITGVAGTLSLGQASEVVFMLAMPAFFARLGIKWMMLAGMTAWVVRYGLFAGAAGTDARWMVLIGILLHGICYDFFFVAGQIYIDQRATPDIRAQAQGLIVLVTQGLGLGVGAQLVGWWVGRHTLDGARDWQAIWIAPAVAAAIVAAMFLVLFRAPARTGAQERA